MFSSDAVKLVDSSRLDKSILSRLEKHIELVKLVDDWVLSPNAELLPKLIVAAKVFRSIQLLPKAVMLYRGFDPDSNYQDPMGLQDSWSLWRVAKKHEVGDKFTYVNEKPLSFTTDIGIARAFGSTVVKVSQTTVQNEFLWISDEISFLISRLRNLDEAETQKEVILFPRKTIHFTICEKH
jgi:hypothetical protein